jgi:hypothetical protein
MRLTWVLLSGLSAMFGQDLRVSPVRGAPGERVALEVSLNSPAGKAPAVLRWETIFPGELVDPEGNGPEAGVAARDSGKSVTCAARKPSSWICVLAGGQKPIANGAIAVFHFRIRANARAGTSTFKIRGVEAATLDLREIALKDAEAALTVH